jgi:hypothetical protein
MSPQKGALGVGVTSGEVLRLGTKQWMRERVNNTR